MFRKVRLRLTVLFTAVMTLIMSVMSGFYLYLNHKSLYQNAMISFQNDISSFAVTFEKSTVISYEQILNIQNSYSYDLYIYDNNVPFRFIRDTKTEEQLLFAESIIDNFSGTEKDSGLNDFIHNEYTYTCERGKYCIGMITIFGMSGNTDILVIYSLENIQKQMKMIYIRFAAAIILTSVILFIFSWIFTGILLKPVRESQEKQAQFIAAASHEIRNPVNTILSALGAMEKGDADQQKEFRRIAVKEGRRMAELTNDLLTLTRSDNNRLQLDLKKCEPDTILLDCYEAFQQPAREKNISISAELPDEQISAEKMDPDRIRQVLAILADNAVSYTPQGGKIIFRCFSDGKNCCFEVSDNGSGVPAEMKDKIFERFFRADPSRTDKSHSGLGLSIAKEIVSAHGGNISVHDAPGGGALFRVTIPNYQTH